MLGSGTPSKSVHLNPNWKDDLKKNFLTIIVENCSTVTREAIANDEDLKELLNSNLDYNLKVDL